jgi:hypothetical protein
LLKQVAREGMGMKAYGGGDVRNACPAG